MKKIILFIALTTIIIFCLNTTKEIIIPKESIRFRIIPNSNSIQDIAIKEKVKEGINKEINLLSGKTLNESRVNLKNNIDKIENTVNKVFLENNYQKEFNVNYGYNYFPKKQYKGVTYEAGNYESLVIEIGEAAGDNFWCVLFPPLCMMEQESNIKENEYKFFVSEIINKYF